MRTIATAALVLAGMAPASALDLSGGTLRGSGERGEAAAGADWQAMATLDVDEAVVANPDDQLEAMMAEDGVVLDRDAIRAPDAIAGATDDTAPVGFDEAAFPTEPLDAAETPEAMDEPSAPSTVQEAMLALAPPAPVIEEIPVLHAQPSERVTYRVPRASASLSVIGGGWNLNNPRGSTVTLGADWAR